MSITNEKSCKCLIALKKNKQNQKAPHLHIGNNLESQFIYFNEDFRFIAAKQGPGV